MQNEIKAFNLDQNNSKDRKINKVPIIWLVLREIDSIAGILLLENFLQFNKTDQTKESAIELFKSELSIKKSTFAEETNRIHAISQFIKHASNIIWLIVILIIGISISG